MSGARFLDFAAAVADAKGNGFIHVPVFESEITNLTKKRGIMLQRIKTRRATGHPTRYFEQTARQATAAFADPHNLSATYGGPTRVEKAAFIKAVTSGIKFGHFDLEVADQQGDGLYLKYDDLNDMVLDVLTAQDSKLWTGSDTDLAAPTTNEYVGLFTQIKQTGKIADGVKISTAVRSEVARLAANTKYDVRPSVVVMNPLTKDMMEQEEEKDNNTRKIYEVEAVPGIKVEGIMTCMGVLPIVTDPFMALNTTEGKVEHRIAILTEDLITRFYVGSENVRVFEFGHQDESLATKYMALQYDTIVAKGENYAHTILTKEVATV
jgi:hypothetical protein